MFFRPRSSSSSNSSNHHKFSEQSISSLKKRTRSKVQNYFNKSGKSPQKSVKNEEYQRDSSSSGRGSDFTDRSPSLNSDRITTNNSSSCFQDENVEMEFYSDGLARIIDPRITELDFWRDAVLADDKFV